MKDGHKGGRESAAHPCKGNEKRKGSPVGFLGSKNDINNYRDVPICCKKCI